MKLIFCDSFSYDSVGERTECISFSSPVIVTALRVVHDKGTAHPSLPNSVELRPASGFNLELFAAPLSYPDEACFTLVLTAFDCRTSEAHALQPAMYTEKVLVRGCFEAMTLCLYGERPATIPVESVPVPVDELDPRLLSESALLAQASWEEEKERIDMGTKETDEEAMAESLAREVDEVCEEPSRRRELLARVSEMCTHPGFSVAFARLGGVSALITACSQPLVTPPLISALLTLLASLLDQPGVIGQFLTPDAHNDSSYRILARLLASPASACASIVQQAEQLMLRCHLFEHCTNLARATEETVQASSAEAAHTPVTQSLASLSRIVLLLRSLWTPPSSSSSLAPPPALPPWLTPLLRSLKLVPTLVLLLGTPRLRDPPTRLAAVFQVLRDLCLWLVSSSHGTVYLASEARALIHLTRMLLDERVQGGASEMSGSLFSLPLLLARPDRCSSSLLSLLLTAHQNAYLAAAHFVRCVSALHDLALAPMPAVQHLQSLLLLASRSELGRYAVVTALHWHSCEKLLVSVLQKGRTAVGGLLFVASLSTLLLLAQHPPSSMALYGLYAPDMLASLGFVSLPTDLRTAAALLNTVLAYGHSLVHMPLAQLLIAAKEALASSDKREPAFLCLASALGSPPHTYDSSSRKLVAWTDLSSALRAGLPALLAHVINSAWSALTAHSVSATEARTWLSVCALSLPLVSLARIPPSKVLRASLVQLYVAIASLPSSPLDSDLGSGFPRDSLPDLVLAVSCISVIDALFQDWIRAELANRQVVTLSALVEDIYVPKSGPALMSLLSAVMPLPGWSGARLVEGEAERAVQACSSGWLHVSSRCTFLAAMRLLAAASQLCSSTALLAAVKAVKALVPVLTSAPSTDDSIAHRAAFATLVLARSTAGCAALASAEVSQWLISWLTVSPRLRSTPVALAALTAIVPHLATDALTLLVAQLVPVLLASQDPKLCTAILCVLLRVAETRRGRTCLVQHTNGEWLATAAAQLCAQPLGRDEVIAHLATLVNAIQPSAAPLATTLRAQLTAALQSDGAEAASAIRARALQLLQSPTVRTSNDEEREEEMGEREKSNEAASALPWEMLVDAYFGAAISLDAAVAQELQRQPDTGKELVLTFSSGKRSASESSDGTHEKKKATTDSNSASVFASVVAYTTAARPKADTFRSRRPNTSRQPSRHVDDFVRPAGKAPEPAPQPARTEERRYDFREPQTARELEREREMMERTQHMWARSSDYLPPLEEAYYRQAAYDDYAPQDRYEDYWRTPNAPPPYGQRGGFY